MRRRAVGRCGVACVFGGLRQGCCEWHVRTQLNSYSPQPHAPTPSCHPPPSPPSLLSLPVSFPPAPDKHVLQRLPLPVRVCSFAISRSLQLSSKRGQLPTFIRAAASFDEQTHDVLQPTRQLAAWHPNMDANRLYHRNHINLIQTCIL